jgi:hypothetical protein
MCEHVAAVEGSLDPFVNRLGVRLFERSFDCAHFVRFAQDQESGCRRGHIQRGADARSSRSLIAKPRPSAGIGSA